MFIAAVQTLGRGLARGERGGPIKAGNGIRRPRMRKTGWVGKVSPLRPATSKTVAIFRLCAPNKGTSLLWENRFPVVGPPIMAAEVFPEAPESSVPTVELSPAPWPEPRVPVRATHE